MWVKRYKIYLGLFKVTVDFQNNFLCVTFKIVLPHVCSSDSNRKKDTISLRSSDGKGCQQLIYIVVLRVRFLHRTNELISLKLPDVSYLSLWVKGFLPNTHSMKMASCYPFICWWASRLLLCPGYYKQCCDEHWGARVSFRFGFLRVYAQKWYCWVIWRFYFQFFKKKKTATLFSIVAVLVCIPTNSVRGFPFLHTLSSIYCL